MPSVGWARRGALAIPDALGTRIRKARLELGLSLAQVAGTEFSRSFLNQVELGRARPSTRTLQVISDRLHRPLEFFLLDPKDSTTVVELLLAEAGTRLRQGGIFGLVRHPVYGGVILIGLGWSLADAPLGLVPTALLAVLFDLKAQREEAWLIERFPEYAAYRAGTPRRFVPWLY